MKKYAIILTVLTLIGIGLTGLLYTQDEKLDQTVFIQTTDSIRNLQNLDKNLLVYLSQSRFNADFDHEVLFETNYQLSEEFSNLRYEALFEEIEASEELSAAIKQFDDRYISREEELEIYVDENQKVISALEQLKTDPFNQSQIARNINSKVFASALNPSVESTQAISDQLQQGNDENEPLSPDYNEAVESYLDSSSVSNESYQTLSKLETGPLLDGIEKAYVNYHNQAIKSSNQFKLAMIAYGALLLVALLFFAAQIRKNFLFLEQEVADRTTEIKAAYEDLQESQEQLIQSEKMDSLGQMVAGVAHEINTPLGYVSSNIETLKLNITDVSSVISELETLMGKVNVPERDNKAITQQLMRTLKVFKDVEAKELADESNQLLEDGAYGLNEMSTLVGSLKDFARLDRKSTDQINIHDCIDSSLTIASNHIRENNVAVVKDYDDLPKIACIPSKLNQLFLNIITNGCQAMSENGGQLTIKTTQDNDNIRIQFTDQGIGMDEATKQKMFDPFFTSKEIGVGTDREKHTA